MNRSTRRSARSKRSTNRVQRDLPVPQVDSAALRRREGHNRAHCQLLRLPAVGHGDVGDLLGHLVEQFYTADEAVKPTPDHCAQLLSQVQVVIVLDDVLLDPEQVEQVLRVLPDCSLLLGSPGPSWADTVAHRPWP